MSDDETERVTLRGLRDLLERFKAAATSPSEFAELVLDRVATLPADAAVLTSCDPDRLRTAAAAATARWAAGSARALEGVPVVVKDNFAVDGFLTTAGGRARAGIPIRQATAVSHLVAAGAIPFAKTNMTEYALRSHGRNAFFGDVRAPFAPGYLAGGSSSGSAAAVRLGLAPVALGSDTGGSVRIPAACCGVVGYKPAYGDIPTDGLVALSPTCDHVGILAARVDDLGLVLPVLGAPAQAPGDSLPVVTVPAHALGPLDPGVREAHERAGALLDAAEHVPRCIAGGALEQAIDAYEAIRGWEAGRAYGPVLRERPAAFGDEAASILRGFMTVTEAEYHAGLAARECLREVLVDELQGRAVMLLPTARVPAPPVDATELVVDGARLPLHMGFVTFALAFSLTGVPAVAVPAGRLPGGLTASVQLVGAPGDEGALLSAARRLEAGLRRGP